MEGWWADAATVWGSLVPIVEVAIVDVDVLLLASMTGAVDPPVEGHQSNKFDCPIPSVCVGGAQSWKSRVGGGGRRLWWRLG